MEREMKGGGRVKEKDVLVLNISVKTHTQAHTLGGVQPLHLKGGNPREKSSWLITVTAKWTVSYFRDINVKMCLCVCVILRLCVCDFVWQSTIIIFFPHMSSDWLLEWSHRSVRKQETFWTIDFVTTVGRAQLKRGENTEKDFVLIETERKGKWKKRVREFWR